MAGTIIADYIRADANKISLNVGNTVVATINASGILSNTGTVMIAPTGAINANNISTGTVPQSVMSRTSLPVGSVLQVVYAAATTQVTSTTSDTWVDTGLTASITPTSSSSKILILVNQHATTEISGENQCPLQLLRGSTRIAGASSANVDDYYRLYVSSGTGVLTTMQPLMYLDSPSSTTSTTYKMQMSRHYGTYAIAQKNGQASHITLLEIAA